MLRSGDRIIRQQVSYCEPGDPGENVLWDFRDVDMINEEYEHFFSSPFMLRDSLYLMGNNTFPVKDIDAGELIIETGHNTQYYYHLKNDSLLLLGYDNPTIRMNYDKPVLIIRYPFSYQQELTDDFISQGLYSGQIPIRTEGSRITRADAFGSMILPSGDTLKNVMRIKSVQTIFETDDYKSDRNKPYHSVTETYRWYLKGYRYPVFESINVVSRQQSPGNVIFQTSFFYPLPEHTYLKDDKENLVELQKQKYNEINQGNNLWTKAQYRIYPNPVTDYLKIEINLPEPANVRVKLSTSQGHVIVNENYGNNPTGLFAKQIFMSPFIFGEYVLNVWLNDYMISEKILK